MNQPSSKIKSSTSPVYVQLLIGVSSFASGFLSVYAPQRGKLHETMLQPRNFFLSKNFFAESLDNSMPEWYSNHCRTAAGVVELVDTGDLKSPGSDTVPVRARSPAPSSYRGVEQLVARRAHNPEVAGSSPVSATTLCDQKRYRTGKPRSRNGFGVFSRPFLTAATVSGFFRVHF